MNLNADEIKFRASSMGNLQTGSRDKKEPFGDVCKKELCKAFAYYRAGIQEQIESKYFEKGHKREELGITYYSAVLRQKLQKNETRLFDDVCTGLPDLYLGKDIHSAEIIPDIKNAWSYVSFLKTITKPIEKDRYWQGQTYMRLTGAKEAHFVVCCVNAPLEMIKDECRRAMYKMGVSEEDDPAYIEKCLSIERSMIMDMVEFKKEYPYAELYSEAIKEVKESFVSIPWEQRIHVMKVLRNDLDIKAIEDKAPHWRKYIQETFIDKKEN